MPNYPTFFFSHARQDREMPGKYLSCFFKDLEKKLAQWEGIDLSSTKLGTIDSRVQHGNDWDADLSSGLSENRAFLAVITPFYFKRPNCGKEIYAFVVRSRGLGIDPNGALTGVKNLLVIRWQNAYAANRVKDSRIPLILRRIEDTPADDGSDADRTRAIELYRKKGMEKCVAAEPHYSELLDLFAACIRDMPELPTDMGPVSFATTPDAFEYDWMKHFNAVSPGMAQPPPVSVMKPQALSSVVAFYITHRQFTATETAADYADRLIAEPVPGPSAPTDPVLAALFADVRAAGVAEGLTVFHAAADPILPASPEGIIKRLASLSTQHVLTALIIDPDIWPGRGRGADAAPFVEEIIRSPDWIGPALVHAMDDRIIDAGKFARGLSSRVDVLPKTSEARVEALRRAFVAMRGSVLRAISTPAPGAERVPLPSVGRERG